MGSVTECLPALFSASLAITILAVAPIQATTPSLSSDLAALQNQLQDLQARLNQLGTHVQPFTNPPQASSLLDPAAGESCSAQQECCTGGGLGQGLTRVQTLLNSLSRTQQGHGRDISTLHTSTNKTTSQLNRQQNDLHLLNQGQIRKQHYIDSLTRGQTKQQFDLDTMSEDLGEWREGMKQDMSGLNETYKVIVSRLEVREELNVSQLVQGQGHQLQNVKKMTSTVDWILEFTARPASCRELNPKSKRGVKRIWVTRWFNQPVYCEGDWIVIQRRDNGRVDFNRYWDDYKSGFGNINGELWLGLETVHRLTSSGRWELRVELEDWQGNTAYALYSGFSVGPEIDYYRLSIEAFVDGTAGDSLFKTHRGKQFSTRDEDHDGWGRSCAAKYKGGWWYFSCLDSNLNGLYLKGGKSKNAGIIWKRWKGYNYSLKSSVMKIRPV